MYTFLAQASSVFAILLIMTVSPVPSMEMTTAFELAESGIVITFSDITQAAVTPSPVRKAQPEPKSVTRPPPPLDRFELPESGLMLDFSADPDPTGDSPSVVRHIAKPYVKTPAPWAGAPYLSVHSFELPESGQVIVIRDMDHASANGSDRVIVADK